MITITLPEAAIFFPDDEITEAKEITRAGRPAIAFKAAGTGGLQFIKTYSTPQERDRALLAVREAQKLQERLKETEKELEKMREESLKKTSEKKKTTRKKEEAKKKEKTEKKEEPEKKEKSYITPPTYDELIAYIKEKNYDKELGVPAEIIADTFVSVYETREPTGKTDENGFMIYKWKKATGEPVKDWKGCLRTFKNNRRMWKAERRESRTERRTKNQFTAGVENNDYDFEELERELVAT